MADTPLRVLVVDDEQPALDELAYLLERDPRVGEIQTAPTRRPTRCGCCTRREVDAVFLDIEMPGPGRHGAGPGAVRASGARPPIVFVTAYDEHAVDAFELDAVDYLLKPVRGRAAGRGAPPGRRAAGAPAALRTPTAEDETIPVELGGRDPVRDALDVRYVEAQGDYARLHTARRQPPGADPARHAGGATGATPASCACTARCWSRSPHVDEVRIDGRPVRRRRRRRRSCRSAAGTPVNCATCWCARPPGAVTVSGRRTAPTRPRGSGSPRPRAQHRPPAHRAAR